MSIRTIWGYSSKFHKTVVFDRIKSLRVTCRYYEDGDFELHMAADDYLWNSVNSTEFLHFEGIRGVWHIRTRQMIMTPKEQSIVLKGYEMTYILKNRVVLDVPVWTGHTYALAANKAIGRNTLIRNRPPGTPYMWTGHLGEDSPAQYVAEESRGFDFLRVYDQVGDDDAPEYRKLHVGSTSEDQNGVPMWSAFHNLSEIVRGLQVRWGVGMYTTLWENENARTILRTNLAGGVTLNIYAGRNRARGQRAFTTMFSPHLDNIAEWKYTKNPDWYKNFMYRSTKTEWANMPGPFEASQVQKQFNGWATEVQSPAFAYPRYVSIWNGVQTEHEFLRRSLYPDAPKGLARREQHEWITMQGEPMDQMQREAKKKAFARWPWNNGQNIYNIEATYRQNLVSMMKQSMHVDLEFDMFSQTPPFAVELVVEQGREPIPHQDYHCGDIVSVQLPIYERSGMKARELRVTELVTNIDAGGETTTLTLQLENHEDVEPEVVL